MTWLMVLFAAKEIIMGISGLVVIKKKDVVNSSQWFGKLTTVVIYGVMIILFLFPGLSESIVNAMIIACAAVIVLSLVKYMLFYKRLFSR